MLKHLFVDNFRTFQNFEMTFDRLTLLLGPNGGGKSSIFDVITILRDFIATQRSTHELLPTSTLTRWQSHNLQTFEMRLEYEDLQYVYTLEIEHDRYQQRSRVKSEKLLCNNSPLYESKLESDQLRAQLFRDDGTKGSEVLVDWTRSGVGFIQPRQDNRLLTNFRQHLSQVIVTEPVPQMMGAEADGESAILNRHATNFVEWFRYAASLDLNLVSRLDPLLEDTLPGYEGLSLVLGGGDSRILEVRFSAQGTSDTKLSDFSCRFDELSDGQRMLFALYTLMAATELSNSACVLCLDEPENFLALREIQPWLNKLIDRTQTFNQQVVLISHHPELINTLAGAAGRWLDRTAGASTRCQLINADQGGLPISELVARGWIHV